MFLDSKIIKKLCENQKTNSIKIQNSPRLPKSESNSFIKICSIDKIDHIVINQNNNQLKITLHFHSLLFDFSFCKNDIIKSNIIF